MVTRMDQSTGDDPVALKNKIIKATLKGQFGQNAQKCWRDYNGPTGIKPTGKRFDPDHPEKYNPKYIPCPFPKEGLPLRDFNDYLNHKEERCNYHVKSTGREAPFEAAIHAEKHFDWWYDMNEITDEKGVKHPPGNTYPIVIPRWSEDGPMSPEDTMRKKMREKLMQEEVAEEHKQEVEEAKTDFSEEKRRVGRPPKVTV